MATLVQTRSSRLKSLLRVTGGSVTLALVVLVGVGGAQAQSFTSGSTGADGALDFSGVAPGTTVIFDPAALRDPRLDPEGDSVYHFTTINIPADVTVQLRADVLGAAPVHWLATGAVQIDGTLDLSGQKGHLGDPTSFHNPSVPGPGGFPGGSGQRSEISCISGFGPGRGLCTSNFGGGGSYGSTGTGVRTGTYGNRFILPLVGGSGGAGGGFSPSFPSFIGSGGGAGGGAILIASSVSITINGAINANGGAGGDLLSFTSTLVNIGGAGSGGAVRLLAPGVTVAGTVTAASGGRGRDTRGTARGTTGGLGRLRIEAEEVIITGTLVPTFGDPLSVATLLPSTVIFGTGAAVPSVRVVSVAGVPVPANPMATFTAPDIAINSPDPVTMAIAASNIPPGTVVTLRLINETTGEQTVASTELVGNLADSTATASATFSAGVTQVIVQASFTP